MKTVTCPKCGSKRGAFQSVCSCGFNFSKAEIQTAEGEATDKGEAAARLVRALASTENMLVTTETWIGDVERLGIVASEVVFGMNVFKDVLANLRDVFGGRSGTVQKVLADARLAAFEDLREQAIELGADAIIAVDVDYHSIATGSALNMMMVAVSGTAVKREDRRDGGNSG